MLAVVVLNWNGGEDTLACVASVAASDLPDLQIYVADNGSTDGSLERVRERFPQVHVVENGANLGFCGGNNRGWRAAVAAGARRVLFVNNDAVVAPDTIRLLSEAMDAHPDVGAVSPRIFRGVGFQSGESDVWYENARVTLDRFNVADHIPAGDAARAAPLYDVPTVCGCALLIGAESLAALGGFDEAYFAYFEDVDLSLKLQKSGRRCAVVPAARVWHKVSASTGDSFSPTATFYLFRNGRRLARRHADRASWRRYRRAFFRAWLGHAAWLSLKKGPAVGAAALQGGFCALLGKYGARPARFAAPFRWAALAARAALRLRLTLIPAPAARS